MDSKKWTNTKLFWCTNDTIVKIGLHNSLKVFRLEVKLKKIADQKELKFEPGQSLFTKEGYIIKKVNHNAVLDGKLSISGELERDFDLENYEPEEFDGKWYELKDVKSHTYEDGSTLYTYTTIDNQELIRLFQYRVPKDYLGDIDCSHFRGDKEDEISEVSSVSIDKNGTLIRGIKTKLL
ncbi:hypothetical protein [Priestia aryabhattai]